MLFEDFGGFDGLYMKMLACGIPSTVHLMWIPFSELDIYQQFTLVLRISQGCLNALWKTRFLSSWRSRVFEKINNVFADFMIMIVFPTVEFLVPYSVLYVSF